MLASEVVLFDWLTEPAPQLVPQFTAEVSAVLETYFFVEMCFYFPLYIDFQAAT